MKLLVETTGQFMLIVPGSRDEISAHRPSVVSPSSFVNQRAAVGQLSTLGQVADEATDAEFGRYWHDSGDRDLAISSFLEAFPVSGPIAPEKKTTRGKK